jgi:transposase
MSVARLLITVCLSRLCCTAIVPGLRGAICQSGSGNRRHSRWAASDVWEKLFKHLSQDADNEYTMIDATIVRAHQYAARAKKKTVTIRHLDAALVD